MFKRIKGKFIFPIVFVLLICLGPGNLWPAEKQLIDQEHLNHAIGLSIEKNMPWAKDSMRFEVLTPLPEIGLPSRKISWKVEIKGNENYLGDTYFILKLYSKGVLFREEPIKVRIEILQDFVVSSKNLGRDSIINVNDVSVQKKWVRSIPLNSISSIDDVIGKTLCVSLRSNAEISRNMIKEVTAVKRHKMVQVILDNGPINIMTMGMAEEDGVEGSFVRVRNISSNKIIYARVIGESRVKIDFK
ncbi:MAG: flagellar basal body P-ring formation chaperone FlgA [Smithella sp.]